MLARLSAMACQVVVGHYLTEREIGTYAVANGIVGFTCLFRAGGTAHFLPSLTPKEFDRHAGRTLWWGFGFLMLGALLTWGTAVALPHLNVAEPLPELPAVLWVFGFRQVLMAFAQMARMRMTINLRFRELAKLDIGNSILRLLLTALLAYQGYGALALVIPQASATVVELLYCTARAGVSAIDYKWIGMSFRDMRKLMAWPLAIAILISLNTQVNYLLIKAVVPLATLGIFYFAYQFASQPSTLLSSALTNVFAPLVARERGHPAREARVMQRFFSGAMFFIPLVVFALVAGFPAVDRLLWQGKWEAATVPIVFLGIGACFATVVAMLVGPLMGLRQFRAIAGFETMKAVGVLGGAALGAVAVLALAKLEWGIADVTVVAASTAIAIALVSIIQLVWLMRHFGMGAWESARTLLHGPALGAAMAIAAHAIGQSAAASFDFGNPLMEHLVDFSATCIVYLGMAVLAMRFIAENSVLGVVEVLPTRARRVIERLLHF